MLLQIVVLFWFTSESDVWPEVRIYECLEYLQRYGNNSRWWKCYSLQCVMVTVRRNAFAMHTTWDIDTSSFCICGSDTAIWNGSIFKYLLSWLWYIKYSLFNHCNRRHSKRTSVGKKSNWDVCSCLYESWFDFTGCLLEQISPVKSWSCTVQQKLRLRSVLSKTFTHHHKKCLYIEALVNESTCIQNCRTDLCVHNRVKSSS